MRKLIERIIDLEIKNQSQFNLAPKASKALLELRYKRLQKQIEG